MYPGMTSKSFALFSTLRTIYVNEEPDRNNPYLMSMQKTAAGPGASNKKPFDECSVSSDDSDEDAVIFIRSKEEPVSEFVHRMSQDEIKQHKKKHTE
jgi:hypothetical protein